MKNRLFVVAALCLGIAGGAFVGLAYSQTQRRPSFDEQLQRKNQALRMAQAELEKHPQPYVHVVDIIQPSVVQITVTRRATPPQRRPQPERGQPRDPSLPPGWPFEDDPFEQFFRRRPQQQMPMPRAPQTGVGSGFIIDREGHIITNNHVIAGGDEIVATLYDGSEYRATLVGSDPQTDLALIKIDAADIMPATLGDSSKLLVGQEVMAFGSPFRLSFSASRGIVSAVGRSGLRLPGEGPIYQDFIQTDAAINPGNSGGPLVNLNGEVIGINAAITSASGVFAGVGFAIPIGMAKEILPQLKVGEVVRGWLGVSLNPDTDIVRQFGAENGVLLDQVFPDSPAAKAGLKHGDVVVAIDGRKVEGFEHLRRMVAALKPDQRVEVEVVREGDTKTIEVVIGRRPDDLAMLGPGMPAVPEAAERPDTLGIMVQNLTPELTERIGIEGPGVLVSEVEPDSPAERAGLAPGVVIAEVSRTPVATAAEYRREIERANLEQGALLLVRTQAGTRYVVVKSR